MALSSFSFFNKKISVLQITKESCVLKQHEPVLERLLWLASILEASKQLISKGLCRADPYQETCWETYNKARKIKNKSRSKYLRMNELALNAVYLYSYNSSNFMHSKLFNMYGDSSFQTRWMFCRYFTKVPTTCQTPLPLVYSGATFSLSNYVINGLLKLQANHHHGERLTLPANL